MYRRVSPLQLQVNQIAIPEGMGGVIQEVVETGTSSLRMALYIEQEHQDSSRIAIDAIFALVESLMVIPGFHCGHENTASIYASALALTRHRPRKDGRGSNQLLTLRRSSTTPHGGSNTPGSSHDVNTMPAIEDQQSHASGQSQSSDNGVRYTKEALLEIYRNQQISGSDFDVSRLLYNGWDPSPTSANGGRGWGKTGEARDSTHGAEICWDQPGEVEPIALSEMTSLEKNVRQRVSFIVMC